MKRFLLLVCLLAVVWSGTIYAQLIGNSFAYEGDRGGLFMGGIGYSKIDDESYYAVQLRPELAFGKLGIGLNLNLLYSTDTGHIRSKDWDTGYDYFRILRYLRYGRKNDGFYTRVGSLDAARLGHGFIVNYYTNEANYDERKIGLALDMDFGTVGVETLTSNLGRSELIGVRGYVRPLLNRTPIPIIGRFAIGATFARDFDPDAWSGTDDGVSVYGFDMELPLLETRILHTLLYYDYAQIAGYSSVTDSDETFGHGQAVGVQVDFGHVFGLIDLSARLERRWLGDQFVPSFFDPFYEIQRYQLSSGESIHKTDLLWGLDDSRGVFGELYGGLLGHRIRLIGMMSRLDGEKNSGNMHLAAEAVDAIPMLAAHATYDKIGIDTVEDVFTLDNQSVARVGLGYKVTSYLIVFMDYIWTFVETEPGSREYKPQERVEPKLVFSYEF